MEGGRWCEGGVDVLWEIMPQPLSSKEVSREMEGDDVVDRGLGLV